MKKVLMLTVKNSGKTVAIVKDILEFFGGSAGIIEVQTMSELELLTEIKRLRSRVEELELEIIDPEGRR